MGLFDGLDEMTVFCRGILGRVMLFRFGLMILTVGVVVPGCYGASA